MMRRHLRVVALVLVAGWAANASQARADGKSVPGVVAVGGDAEERDRTTAMASASAALQSAGWQLPAKPLTKKDLEGLLHCLDAGEPWGCIPAAMEGQGIHRAFVVGAAKQRAEDGSRTVLLTAKLVVTSPHVFVTQQRFCEHCNDDTLGVAVKELVGELLQQVTVRLGRTVLVVKSEPTGARILLDGVPIGATNTTFNTGDGPHVVIIEKAGYITQTVNVETADGKTAEVAVTLHPSTSAAPPKTNPKPTPAPSRLVPGIAIGVGAALLAESAFSFYRGTEGGPDEETQYTHATTIGVVTGIAGLGAIGLGAYLWWRATKASAPTVSSTPGGAIVGWAGTF